MCWRHLYRIAHATKPKRNNKLMDGKLGSAPLSPFPGKEERIYILRRMGTFFLKKVRETRSRRLGFFSLFSPSAKADTHQLPSSGNSRTCFSRSFPSSGGERREATPLAPHHGRKPFKAPPPLLFLLRFKVVVRPPPNAREKGCNPGWTVHPLLQICP